VRKSNLGSTGKRAPAGFAPLALRFDVDPPERNSRNQLVSQSRSQHRDGVVGWRCAPDTILAVWAGIDHRGCAGHLDLQVVFERNDFPLGVWWGSLRVVF